MKTKRVAATAAFMSLIALVSLAGPASAQVLIKSHGHPGDWGFNPADDSSTTGATCGYGAPDSVGSAHLKWIKVRPPRIAARDVTGGEDHQMVSWQVLAQRKSNSGSWVTMARSAVHSAKAYDDQYPIFNSIKVYVYSNTPQLWRAVVYLKWLRNGSAEAWIKARMEFYGVKWTVGSPDYVYEDACNGMSD